MDGAGLEPITAATSGGPDLSGRVAIVTGAARGIGRATAELLAAHGATLGLFDLDEAHEALGTIEAAGGRAATFVVDIADGSAVAAAVAEVVARFGRIDILVNNAGVGDRVSLEELDRDFFVERMQVNVLGAMLCTRAVLEPMTAQGGGKIVTVSSVSAKVGGVPSRDPASGAGRSGPTYAAAKGALISFNRWIAKDAGRHGVHANVICPGPVATDAIKGADYDLSQYPIARLATPEDIAQAVLFLASPMSNYITGQTLNVDGGLRMD